LRLNPFYYVSVLAFARSVHFIVRGGGEKIVQNGRTERALARPEGVLVYIERRSSFIVQMHKEKKEFTASL